MNEASIVKNQLTCTEFLQGMGVTINRAGFCRCPFHGDHDASMKVYRDPQRGYHCFGCHDGGDLIHLAMNWYGLPFKEAIKRTADDFGIDLPEERKINESKRRYSEVMTEMKRIGRQIEAMQRRQDEDAYWSAFDAWLENDRTIREKMPADPLEAFDESWCAAVKQREIIKDNLYTARERRDAHYARK